MNKREFRQLLCSMLIGDGYFTFSDNPKHTRFEFRIEHSSTQKDYLIWKKNLLDNNFKDKKINRECKIYSRQRFDTRTNKTYFNETLCLSWRKYFKFLDLKVYKRQLNQKPIKDVEFLLSQMLTDKHLAIWLMDDGSESRTKAKHIDGVQYYKNPYFRLATQNFTLGQIELIKQWFFKNYQINPNMTMQKSGPIIQFSVADTKKLFPKIRPYIVQTQSMRNKFRICLERY